MILTLTAVHQATVDEYAAAKVHFQSRSDELESQGFEIEYDDVAYKVTLVLTGEASVPDAI